MNNSKILIFGGSGSLGNELVSKYIKTNELYIYSRDECKHWTMKLKYNNNNNLNFIIGNIRNKDKINQTINRVNPDIIIIAAALKHIDKCEYECNESISTNILGIQNILNCIETNKNNINLKTVCFISTDKACSPVNVYGMCKAISECLIIEKSKYIKNIKFVNVRYGNVLNSRGSIIPILHNIGKSPTKKYFTLTSDKMTRFVMTLKQSVDLIEYAILNGESGDTITPELISCKIKDLIEIFSEIYNKPIKVIGLRPGEKLLESLINNTQSIRLVNGINGYKHVKPPYKKDYEQNKNIKDYNSKINPLSKNELQKYLKNLNLL